MQKIIIIGPAYPFRGGIAHFSLSLARAFQKAGTDISLVTFTLQYPGFLFPGRSQFEEGLPPDGIAIRRWLNSVNPLSWFRSARRIRAMAPDYVVVQYWMPFMAPCLGAVSRLIRKKGGPRVVAIVHNATPHEGRLLDRQLSRYFFRSCDAFITLSSSVLDDLSGYHPGAPARTVYHPLYSFFGDPLARDAAISYLKLDPDKKYLLFFGLVRRYKGLDLLLEALAHPLIRPLNIHLLVAGEFYERKLEYEKMIDQLGVGERVIMTDGYVPDADVKYYFSASDMVVLPYRSATQSGVTQVAFQFGCPMLVSDVGGLPELVDHMETGYVTGLSAGEMAGAIHDFYENQRASFFRKNIMERKHRFQWDHVVSELNALGHSPDNSDQT